MHLQVSVGLECRMCHKQYQYMTAPARDNFKFHSRCCSLLTSFILRSLFDHWTQNLLS